MKVLFLDIDGVLNSHDFVRTKEYRENRAKTGFPDCDLDASAIERVNKVCKETGGKIVISSTWREFHDCNPALRRNGLKAIIIDRTPDLTEKLESGLFTAKTRGDEIQAWLDKHAVSNYVILDDCPDMLESQKGNFVHTDDKCGFTDEDMNRAIEILNNN